MAITNKVSEKKLLVTKNKNKVYQPDEIRSHPFRCISLPTVVITFFILYWFVITPVIYYCLHVFFNEWICKNHHLYWLIVFIIFILILIIIVTCWRCKRKQKTPSEGANACGYNIVLQQSQHPYQNSDMSLIDDKKFQKPTEDIKIVKNKQNESCCSLNKDEEDTISQTDVDSKAKFIEYHRLVTTTPTTACTEVLESPRSTLTPRQEFFKEFLFDEKDVKNIEKNEQAQKEVEKEYFIANVPSKSPVLVAEAFIAINDYSVDKSESVREWIVNEEKCTLQPNSRSSISDEVRDEVFD